MTNTNGRHNQTALQFTISNKNCISFVLIIVIQKPFNDLVTLVHYVISSCRLQSVSKGQASDLKHALCLVWLTISSNQKWKQVGWSLPQILHQLVKSPRTLSPDHGLVLFLGR